MNRPTPGRPSILTVQDLSVSFSDHRGTFRAVDKTTFHIDRGESFALVGESGSGKSMTARAIMNLLPRAATVAPESRIHFDGQEITRPDLLGATLPRGRDIAMVLQDPSTSLNPVRTIGAQVGDPLRFHLGMRRSAVRASVVNLLGEVGLPDPGIQARRYPHELSGGMRQRAMIAMALACGPKLLIADEPTAALDVMVKYQVLELLQHLRQQRGMALLVISHDLGIASDHADRVAVMYAGAIVETAPAGSLFAQPKHRYTEALIAATPSVDLPPHTRLLAIGGQPPDPFVPIVGCRFAPRCEHARADCTTDRPLETRVGVDHLHYCLHPPGSAAPGSACEPVGRSDGASA